MMEDNHSDDYLHESDPNVSADQEDTSAMVKPSASRYRNIKAQTNSKLIHLAKRLILENTQKSFNEALKIAVLLLRSIPPRGYLAEDLFFLFIHLIQSNEEAVNLFLKFLSIAGSTTPYLRPAIMTHGARMLASKGHIYEMKHQIQRNCTEWNLEKHQTAKHYKWIIQHADVLGDNDRNYSSDYRVELENIIMTYAELKVLPNASLLRLFIESHANYAEKVLNVLNLFISLFPNIHFLRKYRAQQSTVRALAEDIIHSVHDSAYASSSVAFALKNKDSLTLRQLLLLLFDIVISQPVKTVNWERLLYHLLTEAEFDDMLDTIHDIFEKELRRAKSIFTAQGTLAKHMTEKTIKYYLATAKIVLFRDIEAYKALYEVVKSATGVTLERKHMEANNPIWLHFKKIPKQDGV